MRRLGNNRDVVAKMADLGCGQKATTHGDDTTRWLVQSLKECSNRGLDRAGAANNGDRLARVEPHGQPAEYGNVWALWVCERNVLEHDRAVDGLPLQTTRLFGIAAQLGEATEIVGGLNGLGNAFD